MTNAQIQERIDFWNEVWATLNCNIIECEDVTIRQETLKASIHDIQPSEMMSYINAGWKFDGVAYFSKTVNESVFDYNTRMEYNQARLQILLKHEKALLRLLRIAQNQLTRIQ